MFEFSQAVKKQSMKGVYGEDTGPENLGIRLFYIGN